MRFRQTEQNQGPGFCSVPVRTSKLTEQAFRDVFKGYKDRGFGYGKPGLSSPCRSLEFDIPQRRVFADWVLEMHANGPEFHRKITLTDGAQFHLGGYVNKQNCRIWGSVTPRVVAEKPLHPHRVTVWCGLRSGGVIGHYFFEIEIGSTVTVNELRYRDLINDLLWSELDA